LITQLKSLERQLYHGLDKHNYKSTQMISNKDSLNYKTEVQKIDIKSIDENVANILTFNVKIKEDLLQKLNIVQESLTN